MADEQEGYNSHSPAKRSRTLSIDISQAYIEGQQLCKYLIDRFLNFKFIQNPIRICIELIS